MSKDEKDENSQNEPNDSDEINVDLTDFTTKMNSPEKLSNAPDIPKSETPLELSKIPEDPNIDLKDYTTAARKHIEPPNDEDSSDLDNSKSDD